jgi:ankyrin repeat protein
LFLAGYFEAWQSSLAPKSVLVYFCDDKITKQKDANGILSGLIFQIICRHRSLIRHVKRVFEIRGPTMVQSFSTLWRVCLDVILDPKCGPTYIIIDGLDECEHATRRKLVESIHAFLHSSSCDTGTKKSVKFILTSRPSTIELETIAEQVADHRISIDEDQEGYLEDLKAYIHRRVDEISPKWKLSFDEKTFLEKSLLSQAGETFLWVHMVLAWLESQLLRSKNILRDILTRIPPNLETTYLGFLTSIPPGHEPAASKFLLLILGSSRPLSLEELNIAFTVQETHRTLEDVSSDLQTAIQHTIQGILGPLVRASESRVSFVHQSVKDFLLQQAQIEDAPPVTRGIKEISAALSISTACIRYLRLEDFSKDLFSSDDESPLQSPISFHGSSESHAGSPTGSCTRRSWDEDADELGMAALFKEPEVLIADACQLLAEKYAFYRYASLHWTEHYAICEELAPVELRDAVRSLLDITTSHGANWWRFFTADSEHKTKYIPSRPSRLTLAAFFNLNEALNAELGHQTELLSVTRDDALFWAAHEGHSSIVETLLLAGADPNAHDLDRHTALTVACKNGHLACVVALLRDQRTNINVRGEKGRTALSLACSNQHPDVVQKLLSTAECDAAIQDDLAATALHWACSVPDNDLPIAALLKHHTVSPNHRDKNGRTALSWAAGHGVETAVKALMDVAAVDTNLADIQGRSPLSWAAGNGRLSTARLLVQSDKVNRCSVDKDGRNSFSWAAGNGHADVLRMLIKNKCPGVDDPDVDHWAPLSWATHNVSPRAAEVLVSTRVIDLERRDKDGQTALAWAVSYRNVHIVKTLLRAGANPLSTSNSGATPLSVAQKPGWERILDELLRYTKDKNQAGE